MNTIVLLVTLNYYKNIIFKRETNVTIICKVNLKSKSVLKFNKIGVSLCPLLSLVGDVMLIVFYNLMNPSFANNNNNMFSNETIPYPSHPLSIHIPSPVSVNTLWSLYLYTNSQSSCCHRLLLRVNNKQQLCDSVYCDFNNYLSKSFDNRDGHTESVLRLYS